MQGTRRTARAVPRPRRADRGAQAAGCPARGAKRLLLLRTTRPASSPLLSPHPLSPCAAPALFDVPRIPRTAAHHELPDPCPPACSCFKARFIPPSQLSAAPHAETHCACPVRLATKGGGGACRRRKHLSQGLRPGVLHVKGDRCGTGRQKKCGAKGGARSLGGGDGRRAAQQKEGPGWRRGQPRTPQGSIAVARQWVKRGDESNSRVGGWGKEWGGW